MGGRWPCSPDPPIGGADSALGTGNTGALLNLDGGFVQSPAQREVNLGCAIARTDRRASACHGQEGLTHHHLDLPPGSAGRARPWLDRRPGWRLDNDSFLQRFTPRRPTNTCSLRIRRRGEAMVEEGTMTPQGLAEVERAEGDRRWNAPTWASRSARAGPRRSERRFGETSEVRPTSRRVRRRAENPRARLSRERSVSWGPARSRAELHEAYVDGARRSVAALLGVLVAAIGGHALGCERVSESCRARQYICSIAQQPRRKMSHVP